MNTHVVLIGIVVGVLATFTMDLGSILGLRLGIAGKGPRRTGADFIGRWFGYLIRGKFKHADILETPPLPGEIPLGLLVHYLIGIVLTLVYIAILLATQASAGLLTAVVYGLATTLIPWFYLYPAWGYGLLGREVPGDSHMARMSLYSHLIFGFGLALWMAVLRPL